MIPYGGLDDAGVKSGDTVVVAPATGRFSGSAVITALAMGANVIATGRNQAKLDDLVKAVGSPKTMKSVVMSGEVDKDTAALSRAVGPRGADVVLDLSPAAAGANGQTPSYLLAGLNVLRRGGTLSLMGGLPGTIAIPYLGLMLKNIVVRGRYMYERDQIEQVIKLAESGQLRLGKDAGSKVVGKYSLEQFEKALDEAEANPGWGNVVGFAP
jgi:D-arabinose 1-dehydrogenase-like Zn-dependent alcohol dehydrogenase